MAIIRPDELRDMTPAERAVELEELETELLNAKAVQAAGGAPENPGRIGELKRTIARIKTIQREEGDIPSGMSESPSGGSREDGDLEAASAAGAAGGTETEEGGGSADE